MKTNLMIVVMLVFLICFQLAWAKTLYRYQRDDGVIVTTDLFDNVPEKYRDSVEKVDVPEESKTKLLMKENIEKGKPALCGLSFWASEFGELIIGRPKDEVLTLLGKPKSVSGSERSRLRTWGYDSYSLCWSVRDNSSRMQVKTIILTLEYKNQDYYVVDIYYSR